MSRISWEYAPLSATRASGNEGACRLCASAWREYLGAARNGFFAVLRLGLYLHRFRSAGNGIVVPEPLLHRFSLRQGCNALPTGSAGANDVLRHQVVVGIVNVHDIAGLRALTMIGIGDFGVVMVLH